MKKILLVFKKLLFIVGFCCVFLFNNTQAQGGWTSGGPYGGIINSIAMSQTNPDVMYAGTPKGVYKTVDGSQSWVYVGLSEPIRVVQIDPLNSDIVYAGTSYEIYKSENGGVTWDAKGFPVFIIKTIAIDPLNPLIIYVGTAGYSWEGGCVYKSVDGGNTWGEPTLCGSNYEEGILAIIIDNENPAYIYAGLKSAPNSGINFSKSTDGGETWVYNITVGPDFTNDVVALAMTPAGAEEAAIYAVVEGDDAYKSTNRGETWTPTNTPFISGDSPWALAVDPNEPSVIYAGTYKNDSEIYKSEDAGTSWSVMANGLPGGGGPSGIVIDPRNSNVYVGLSDGGGIYASTDGGASWHRQEFPWDVSISSLAVDPVSSERVFAVISGQNHLAVTSNGGASWQNLINSNFNSSLSAVAIDPQNSSNIWVGDGYRNGWFCLGFPPDESCSCFVVIYVYNSKDGGQSWDSYRLGTSTFPTYNDCSASVNDILIKPDDSETILVSMEYLAGEMNRTTNGGDSWARNPAVSDSGPLAANPYNNNEMYNGKSGLVYVSFDGGATWPGYYDFDGTWPDDITSVRDLEVNKEPFDENNNYPVVYAATNYGLMKTVYNGSDWSWEKISGLPTDHITALAIDLSTVPGVIYVGTGDGGVFVSLDGGSIWTSIKENLGDFYIRKLAISASQPKILYAGTNSAGVWSLVIGIDTDSDGLPDDLENTTCTKVDNQDTDSDGILDGLEDTNHDGMVDLTETNPCDVDSDNDGVQDGTELGYTLVNITPDTDIAIFQPDLDPATTTDPLLADTDGDGIPDGVEDVSHNGIVDIEETDPNNPDTDGDGIDDGIELVYWGSNWNADPDGDQLVNLLDQDSDNDGLTDGVEVNILGTNPSLADTDGNGTSDSDEDFDLDGLTNAEEVQCDSDPADPISRCSKGLPWLMLLLD